MSMNPSPIAKCWANIAKRVTLAKWARRSELREVADEMKLGNPARW